METSRTTQTAIVRNYLRTCVCVPHTYTTVWGWRQFEEIQYTRITDIHLKLVLITFLPWKPKQFKNAQMHTNVLIVDMSTLLDE